MYKLKLDKRTFKMILSLAVLVILFAWLIGNAGLVLDFLKEVISILKPLFIGLIIAFLMNIVLRPLERFWQKISPKKGKGKKIFEKLKRPVCIVLSLLLVFGVIFAVIFIVVPEVYRTFMALINKIPEYSDKIELWWNELSEALSKCAVTLPSLDLHTDEIVSKVTEFVAERGQKFLNTTIGFTTSLVSSIANFFIAIVFSVYILAQKESFGAWSKKFSAAMFSPERANSVYKFFRLVNKTFTKFVSGQLTEAVALGSMCFIGMLVLRMPYAPMISVLVGFMALIPIFGAWIATIIGAFLIFLDTPIMAVWFVLFILVLQWFDGNFVYPKIVGKSVGLPALFVLLAVTAGGSAFGIVGMLVSVPTVSVVYTLVIEAVDRRLEEKGITEEYLK